MKQEKQPFDAQSYAILQQLQSKGCHKLDKEMLQMIQKIWIDKKKK